MAFALANERVASVLFGATTAEQVRENVRAAEVVEALSADQLEALRAME
jgi:aryl-alcohol dehydrogenase-like predicted oxidoreductase